MILGVGTDLCEIARMQKSMENPRFVPRVCTPAERERLAPLCPERRAERLAGLFAAKEAVAKALGTGFAGFGFADIEILAEENGRPTARLTGGALNALPQPARIHVSITHDGGLALAFAVIESV